MAQRAIDKNSPLWQEFCEDAKVMVGRKLAQKYHISETTVKDYRREAGIKRITPRKPLYYYTVYKKNTDELLCYGDACHCAEMLGISLSTFYCYVTRKGISLYEIVFEPYRDAIKDENNG